MTWNLRHLLDSNGLPPFMLLVFVIVVVFVAYRLFIPVPQGFRPLAMTGQALT